MPKTWEIILEDWISFTVVLICGLVGAAFAGILLYDLAVGLGPQPAPAWPWWIVAAAAGAIALVVPARVRGTRRLLRQGRRVQGTVQSAHTPAFFHYQTQFDHHLWYTYTAEGRSYRRKTVTRSAQFGHLRKGSPVTVCYDPRRPGTSLLAELYELQQPA